MSMSAEPGSGYDPFGPPPPNRSRWLTYGAAAIVAVIAVACYIAQRVFVERSAEALRDPGATAAAALVPTPEDVVRLGGEDGADVHTVEVELNRDHRIESATAAVEISNDAQGGLVQWLTIDATADSCADPTSDACNQLVDDIAWIALLNYKPLDQLAGMQISVGEQATYRYTIAEWQDRLDYITPEP